MYLQTIQLENIKCFETLEVDFMRAKGQPRLMTVILGDNGLGKSTILQAVAITLGGEKVAHPRVKRPSNWVRVGSKQGLIQATIRPGRSDPGAQRRRLRVSYLVSGDEPITKDDVFYDKLSISAVPGNDLNILKRTAYAEASQGWLACGYGPFRRLTNGGSYLSSGSYFSTQDTKVGRFASLFGDDEGLIQLEDWLLELDRRSMVDRRERQESDYTRLFEQLSRTLFGLLPQRSKAIMVPSSYANDILPEYVKTTAERGVVFLDGMGNWVPLSQLSDGYQSTMAWAGDLISRLGMAL